MSTVRVIKNTVEIIPNRTIICCDAIKWLTEYDGMLPGSVFTSLPDISEMTAEFNGDFETQVVPAYKKWFVDTVGLICSKLKPDSCLIFLQSDARVINDKKTHVDYNKTCEWIDKSFLCSQGVYNNGNMKCLWHKLGLIRALDCKSLGRPAYSHLLCYAHNSFKYTSTEFITPDVFTRGPMLWAKGIGLHSGLIGVNFIRHVMKSDYIIDPFCGVGTVLALGQSVGIPNAIGVELSSKRCHQATVLTVTKELQELTMSELKLYGCDKTIAYQLSSKANNNNNNISTCVLEHTELDDTIIIHTTEQSTTTNEGKGKKEG